MATHKMISVPLKLDGDTFLTMQALSRLSGHDIDTLCSVIVAVAFFRDYQQIAAGLRAKTAEEAAARRPGRKRPKPAKPRRARRRRS